MYYRNPPSKSSRPLIRFFHSIYAFFAGYFWIPCPLCNRKFGGHEWKDREGQSSIISCRPPHGCTRSERGICPWCTVEGKGDTRWWVSEDWTPITVELVD